MPNSSRFSYKGYYITTRWTELAPLSGQAAKRFNASFTVDPMADTEASWQQFPKAVFDTFAGAMANAHKAAMSSIDLNPMVA
jgi:hypothetical protein